MRWFLTVLFLWSTSALAQISAVGTQVLVPAQGEVRHANDEVLLTLLVEEQDKDKGVAASKVNAKMKQGMEIVRREDSSAQLKTRGYYTFPVYPDGAVAGGTRNPQPVAWRVGQHLNVTTKKLAGLPKLVAATQRTLALSSLNFGLSEATQKNLDEQRIAAAYRHLTERIASIAKAMGRSASEATIVSVDLDNAASEAPRSLHAAASAASMRAGDMQNTVEEPSFEPGETVLHMRLVAKILFK
ncbi:MAG: SIMPL domain-containing protein [Pseudomonadota bacterium]